MDDKPEVKIIRFPNGKRARLIETQPTVSINALREWLELPVPRFAIVMHLGALKLDHPMRQRMRNFLKDSVVRFAQDNQAVVVDGGTNAGVMQLMGSAYKALNATFPLIGVTVKNSVTYPGGPGPAKGRWRLNDAHTHFVLVEGNHFGAESQLLVGMARMAGPAGLAIVMSGGDIVRQEIEMHARLGTPIIVIKGTGRYADRLARAKSTSEIRAAFDEGSRLEVFDMQKSSPEALYHLIRRLLLR